ncbi:hypothetical protein [Tenacibaculum ovolyticum]|uniref:hypothetical protein n=1 Tax=Tenacibaculum ovolyticum TaxID=104270 RepID=UPI0004174C79|nr:hypothetical protein [Tenacibaculum ovolyticum]
MEKYWLIKEDESHLLVITGDAVYTGNVKKYIKSELINNLDKGTIPQDIFSIPFSYIKSIENPESKNVITVYYGESSEEEISINNLEIKKEFFNNLKDRLPKFIYNKNEPSIIKHSKPQLFAILIVTGLFVWTFYLANEIAKGFEYEVVGGRQGITGLILGLAQFGTTKVIFGYLAIISIALFTLIKRLKNRVPVEYLIRN